jgi:hypothetical protein
MWCKRKGNKNVFCCHIGDDEKSDNREVPTWMFDPIVCGGMRVLSEPHVSVKALSNLKQLLAESACATDDPAQDRSQPDMEGTDAKPNKTTACVDAAVSTVDFSPNLVDASNRRADNGNEASGSTPGAIAVVPDDEQGSGGGA